MGSTFKSGTLAMSKEPSQPPLDREEDKPEE